MVIVSPPPTARGPLLVACSTDVKAAPCATGLGDFVLVTDRSLPSRWIVKLTNPELLVESGSALEALIEAVFVAAMPAGWNHGIVRCRRRDRDVVGRSHRQRAT